MRALGVAAVLLAVFAGSAQAEQRLLVQTSHAQRGQAFGILVNHGARVVSRRLDIWSGPEPAMRRAIAELRALGVLRSVARNRLLVPRAARRPPLPYSLADPLLPKEWWRSVVGADKRTPPGPGIPVTIIDSGVDATHPEFAARPNTVYLNEQTTAGADEEHGTAVASVAAAPANGVGLVGVYPRARLWVYDASPVADPEGFDLEDEIAAIEAAVDRGRSVINMSLGSDERDVMEEQAVLLAFGTGSLVVVSSGNEFEEGNPVEYPASYNHVLTVSASTRKDRPTDFSNSSLSVDLTAPGVGIPVAYPLSGGTPYGAEDGTSFSAPIVSGAAAWVWTKRRTLDVTQIFEIMRWSARDIWDEDYDKDTGFGVLDIPAALREPAPLRDPQEPNEDVYLVKPDGLFEDGSPLLTRPGKPSAKLRARLDVTEDPSDVYRIWIPANGAATVTVKPTDGANVWLEIWESTTKTVRAKGALRRRDLITSSNEPEDATETASVSDSAGIAAPVYVHVTLAKGEFDGQYTLQVRPGA